MMLLPALQHIWYRPAYDMAVQGAVLQCLNRPHTSTHSGQWNCFGLPMVGRAHEKIGGRAIFKRCAINILGVSPD